MTGTYFYGEAKIYFFSFNVHKQLSWFRGI